MQVCGVSHCACVLAECVCVCVCVCVPQEGGMICTNEMRHCIPGVWVAGQMGAWHPNVGGGGSI